MHRHEIRTVLRPHSAHPAVLRKSADVYARGRTPEITADGRVAETGLKPGGPDLAARHVREIHGAFGDSGVRRTLHGLQVTRGNQFVLHMLAADPGLSGLIHPVQPSGGAEAAIRSARAGDRLPAEVRDQFESATGHDVGGVRIMNDGQAHEAAASVGARAFTVGQRIFFGRGTYSPGSGAGRELIFHELFHTVQQRGATVPGAGPLPVSSPHDHGERQAEAAAAAVARFRGETAANDGEPGDRPLAAREIAPTGAADVAVIQRAITFETATGTFDNHNVAAHEDAAGFLLESATPAFGWTPDVTIHGDAGDAFADWQTAHHQVGKGHWFNVWWGTGANRSHRKREIAGGLPMRDATAAGNTWYSDIRAQGFAADGQTRSPIMRDTPRSGTIPWDNPIPGRAGTRGWFNYGVGFVTTLSARHIPDGTGAAAFRHLNHVHWNFDADGTFDTTAAIGGRVTLNGGVINTSAMIPGIDVTNPPMHGGPIMNDSFVDTDT